MHMMQILFTDQIGSQKTLQASAPGADGLEVGTEFSELFDAALSDAWKADIDVLDKIREETETSVVEPSEPDGTDHPVIPSDLENDRPADILVTAESAKVHILKTENTSGSETVHSAPKTGGRSSVQQDISTHQSGTDIMPIPSFSISPTVASALVHGVALSNSEHTGLPEKEAKNVPAPHLLTNPRMTNLDPSNSNIFTVPEDRQASSGTTSVASDLVTTALPENLKRQNSDNQEAIDAPRGPEKSNTRYDRFASVGFPPQNSDGVRAVDGKAADVSGGKSSQSRDANVSSYTNTSRRGVPREVRTQETNTLNSTTTHSSADLVEASMTNQASTKPPKSLATLEISTRAEPQIAAPTTSATPVTSSTMPVVSKTLASGLATKPVASVSKSSMISPLEASDKLEELAWDVRTFGASTTHSSPQAQHKPEIANHIAQQLAQAMPKALDRSVEIALNPVELGRVRMALTTNETGIVVTITADRPETLDLLRRNIHDLGQSFFDLGYEDIAFEFGQGRTPNPTTTNGYDEDADTSNSLSETLDTSIVNVDLPPLAVKAEGIDVRL